MTMESANALEHRSILSIQSEKEILKKHWKKWSKSQISVEIAKGLILHHQNIRRMGETVWYPKTFGKILGENSPNLAK